MADSEAPEDNAVADDRGGLVSRSADRIRGAFNPGVLVRLQYASYLFFGLVICMIMKGAGGKVFGDLSVVKEGCEFLAHQTLVNTTSEIMAVSATCFQNTLVYRVSFALAVFFLFHFVTVSDLTCCVDAESRAEFQSRFFTVKTALLWLLVIVSFWVPNQFFAGYAWLCMFVSAIFLIIQIVLIVDFSYQWNDDWSERSEDNSKWSYYLVAIAVLSYLFGIAMTVVNYIYFVPHEDCNLHAFAVTSIVVAAVVYTMVAIWVPHGSIVPSGVVFAYTAAVAFSAIRNSTDGRCNTMRSDGESWQMLLLSAVFSGGALAYSVISTGGSRSSLTLRSENELAEENPDEVGHLAGYCFFHAIMMAGSMYLAMLATNWEVSGSGQATDSSNMTAFWVKLSAVWLTIAMYLWTLLAPYFCCKDRDFGIDTAWE